MVDLEKQAQRLTELVTRGVRDNFGETKENAQVARYGDPPFMRLTFGSIYVVTPCLKNLTPSRPPSSRFLLDGIFLAVLIKKIVDLPANLQTCIHTHIELHIKAHI